MAVAVSGVVCGVLVVAANAWMQQPGRLRAGRRAGRSPPSALAPFMSPRLAAAWRCIPPSSCYIATGFAAAGVYALGLLRGRRDAYHRSGLAARAGAGATAAAVLQPISGALQRRRHVARHQPLKLAAHGSALRHRAGAADVIGGIPDVETGTVPLRDRASPASSASWRSTTPMREVKGLDAVPPATVAQRAWSRTWRSR